MRADAKSKDLLYVSNLEDVRVYSYPQGDLEGELSGFDDADGECVDKKGDVFITDWWYDKVTEYAHGLPAPLAVWQEEPTGPGFPIGPSGCAVDPMTGDLAVANTGKVNGYTGGNGYLAIYPGGRQPAKIYTDPDFEDFNNCGYDDKGNLFVDGRNSDFDVEFAELPKGGSSLNTINLTFGIGEPGGVQWDGKHVAIGDAFWPVIYQVDINGSQGTEAGETNLNSASEVDQFFIIGKTVIAPNRYYYGYELRSDVLFYDYPGGGEPIDQLVGGIVESFGLAVSKAAK